MATLVRGAGKKPGTYVPMYRFVARFVPDEGETHQNEIGSLFLTASLFATHAGETENPDASLRERPSFGKSMRAVMAKVDRDSFEQRFVATLDCDAEDLWRHLRALTELAKQQKTNIDWIRFAHDYAELVSLSEGKREAVKRCWALDFWAGTKTPDNDDQSKHQTSTPEEDDL